MSALRVLRRCPCRWRGRWMLLLARLTHRGPWHQCVLPEGHEHQCVCRCGRQTAVIR